jgi:hypothetical protein
LYDIFEDQGIHGEEEIVRQADGGDSGLREVSEVTIATPTKLIGVAHLCSYDELFKSHLVELLW